MDQQASAFNQSFSPEVMVSYSSRDRAQVLQLVQRLRAAGVAVWIDQGGIDGAQRWGEEIVNAIEGCKTVLLMLSQSSAQSENIAKEVSLAWESGKKFLPLYLEEARIPKSMQYPLAGIQHIKLFEGDPESKFISLLRSLMRLDVRMSPYANAMVSADAGDRDVAFQCLNRACDMRSGALARLQNEAAFESLRSDARFDELVARVEALKLDPEDASGRASGVLPRVAPVHQMPPAAAPIWKKIVWPNIHNDQTARKAAAQGVWACAFIVGASFLASILTSTLGRIAVLGLGWNEPLVVALVFVPLAFGIQKMGRPAAVIGLVLCSSGVLGNWKALSTWGAAVDSYSRIPLQFRYQYAYQDPYSFYYYAWFSLILSLACVTAFINATRGTLAYRNLVASGRAQDKQDAVNAREWAEIRSRVTGVAQRFRATLKPRPAPAGPAVSQQVAPRLVVQQSTAPPPMPLAQTQEQPVVPPRPVVHAVKASPKLIEMRLARRPFAPAILARQGFAALAGVEGREVDTWRVCGFLCANIAGGLAYLLSISATTTLPVPAPYWVAEFLLACLFTAAAVAAFRFIRSLWAAAALSAGATAIVNLIFVGMLPTFVFTDMLYREQFQQFVLLPFVYYFIFVAALSWIVPRLQPLPLSLWLGVMSAEILTAVITSVLHSFGTKALPDPVLGSVSLISAILRSLVFTAVLWGSLLYLSRKNDRVA